MCGIAGIISNNSSVDIEKMVESINHRGPDDQGIFYDRNLALGHRRLSIMDLSENGHQPMISLDGRFVLIFNGEIYNHWEIRENLKEYQFKSGSDTETILYGYIKYGIDIFNQLKGIFSIVIYNRDTSEIILCRDQFGVKPLYYYNHLGVFALCSEIKGILTIPGIDKAPDVLGLANYLHYHYSPGTQTPFLHIKKLEPGCFIRFNASNLPENLEPVKYYEIPYNGLYDKRTESELVAELDHRLEKAVKDQLLSDVPVGFFLSGGLDSSAIVAYAAKLNRESRLQCFTIDSGMSDSEEGFADDLYYAKMVAEHLNVDLEIVDGRIDIVKDFDKMIYHMEEPDPDPAPLHIYNICKAAKQKGYKVLLGGTGGDDIFSGYRRHQALYYERYFRNIPYWLRSLVYFISNSVRSNSPFFRRIKKLTRDIKKEPGERMMGYFHWLKKDILVDLFNEPYRTVVKNSNLDSYFYTQLQSISQEKSPLNRMLHLEMKGFLVDHNLNYTDKLSMATGVEVRVPFLDKELVEFAVRIPPELKLKGLTTKYLLKKVMEKYLPKEIIYRPKTGFGAPGREWIKKDMKPLINNVLSKNKLNERGIFNDDKVWELIENNDKDKIDSSYTIWCLLAIETMFSQFKS